MNYDQKLTSKLSQKKVILNGKSEKMTKIDQKTPKSTKTEKCKSVKSDKMQNVKM